MSENTANSGWGAAVKGLVVFIDIPFESVMSAFLVDPKSVTIENDER